jgi:DNA-binding NarL/FixJ family response regulator
MMATVSGIPADQGSPERALAAALGQALLAAEQLRDALAAAARHHADVVAHLARAGALIEAARSSAGSVPIPVALSRREVEVLHLLAIGHSNRRIAAALYLSPRTAQRHVANLYLKLGAHCRAEATAYAIRHGLV